MNVQAKDLRRAFRRQTRCSYFRTILQDAQYDTVQHSEMHEYIDTYTHIEDYEGDSEWDCDDIARDFWNYAKIRAKRRYKQNAIIGLVVFPDHTETVYGVDAQVAPKRTDIYYLDPDTWEIRAPNKKPKWIIL